VDENIPSPQEKGDREAVEEVLHGGGKPGRAGGRQSVRRSKI
jgi:hypothetical protein